MLKRTTTSFTARIANTEDTTDALSIGPMSGGGFYVPASFDGSNITFEVAEAVGGTFAELENDGSAVTVAVTASKWFAFPDSVMVFGAVKLVSDAVMTANRDLIIHLKS